MKHLKKVQDELTKNNISWELGNEYGWSDNSLIFEGGDCKVLLYVNEDEKGKMDLCYYDLFEKGEYNYMTDKINRSTTTSHRGNTTSVKEMLKDVN